MKEELIRLATKEGFKSQFFTSSPWLYSSKEKTRYYLWMCEMQLWLEEEYSIFLSTYFECGAWIWRINISEFETWSGGSGSRPAALEEGLIEALRLIVEKQLNKK